PQKGPRITLIFTDLRRFLERKISVNLRNLWTMILNLLTLGSLPPAGHRYSLSGPATPRNVPIGGINIDAKDKRFGRRKKW
ncbi:MAG: hypothetical protein LBG10_09620, partial [Treponema sp.]|nr:hypothetical protein [Treponema sp.]